MRDPTSTTAASRAGVTVREIDDVGDLGRVASLFGEVWREPGGALPLSAHALRALRLSGNYVAGAYGPDGGLLGGSVAWAAPPPASELHSHITAVAPGHERRGIGLALKLHQADFARARSIDAITWTFDPLVRRNAAFNLRTLGATVEAYLENLYGEMVDELNAGGESDRLLVRWHLSGEAVTRANALTATVAVETPADIESLRRCSPDEARSWRLSLRAQLAPPLARGSAVVGLSERGEYLVEADPVEGEDGS